MQATSLTPMRIHKDFLDFKLLMEIPGSVRVGQHLLTANLGTNITINFREIPATGRLSV